MAALRAEPGAILVAVGDAALAGVLASAIEPPRLAILDVQGFDTSRDDGFLAHLYIPGLRRAGDVQTASEIAQGRLVIHNAGPQFTALRRARAAHAPGPAEMLALVRRARRHLAIGPACRRTLKCASAAPRPAARAPFRDMPLSRHVRRARGGIIALVTSSGGGDAPG